MNKNVEIWVRFLANSTMAAYFIVAMMLFEILLIRGDSYISYYGVCGFYVMGTMLMLQLAYFTGEKTNRCWSFWYFITVVSIALTFPMYLTVPMKGMAGGGIVSTMLFAAIHIFNALFEEAPSVREGK